MPLTSNGRVPLVMHIHIHTSVCIQLFQLTLWSLNVDHKVHIEIAREALLVKYYQGEDRVLV